MIHQPKMGPVRKTTLPRGFTIVELLIVIVVIGILAALVLNSFSDAQRKARNSQTASLVTAYKKALIADAISTGAYPSVTHVCLGTGYPGGNCWAGPNGWIGENGSFNTQIQPYIGLPPQISAKTIDFTGIGDLRSGGEFDYNAAWVLDGVSQPVYIIHYYMEGTGEKCLVGPLLSIVSGGYSSTSPASGYSDSFGKGSVACFLKLPTPGSL